MFTEDEIQLLMDGLDSIQHAKYSDMFSKELLGAMLRPDKLADPEALAAERAKKFEDEKEKFRATGERIILLKAKLIQARDKATVESLNS